MKKMLFLCVFAVVLSVLLTGCDNKKGEKLCRIEISDAAGHSQVAVLEQQSQSDITEFFDEDNWADSSVPSGDTVPQYIITLYQEKTPTVIKRENDEPYEKIMEYVTYENSKTVKAAIGGDVVQGNVSEDFLSAYYLGSDKFFSALSNALKSS